MFSLVGPPSAGVGEYDGESKIDYYNESKDSSYQGISDLDEIRNRTLALEKQLSSPYPFQKSSSFGYDCGEKVEDDILLQDEAHDLDGSEDEYGFSSDTYKPKRHSILTKSSYGQEERLSDGAQKTVAVVSGALQNLRRRFSEAEAAIKDSDTNVEKMATQSRFSHPKRTPPKQEAWNSTQVDIFLNEFQTLHRRKKEVETEMQAYLETQKGVEEELKQKDLTLKEQKATLEELSMKHEDLEARTKNQEGVTKVLEEENLQLKEENTKLTLEIDQLLEKLQLTEEALEENSKLKEENTNLTAKIDTLESELQEQKEKLQEAKNKIDKLESVVQDMESSSSQLESQKTNAMRALEELRAKDWEKLAQERKSTIDVLMMQVEMLAGKKQKKKTKKSKDAKKKEGKKSDEKKKKKKKKDKDKKSEKKEKKKVEVST